MQLLANRVQHILDNCELSISELARRIGCTPSTISQWKSGQTTRIRPEHLFKFADATGFEARRIGTGEGPQQRDGQIRVSSNLKRAMNEATSAAKTRS